MVRFTELAALTALFWAPAYSDDDYTTILEIDPADCADHAGFLKCVDNASKISGTCRAQVEGCDEPQGSTAMDCPYDCDCKAGKAMLDCFGQSCWNMAYSCEYQALAVEVSGYCFSEDFDDIPFFPPPEDAQAGCSCGIGKVIESQYQATQDLQNTCGREAMKKAESVQEQEDIGEACGCCFVSAVYSAMWDICPNTKPSLLGADRVASFVAESFGDKLSNCGKLMKDYPCDTALGMTSPADNTTNFYVEGGFPANGTRSFYNTGTLTSPLSDGTYTYTWDDDERTVTVRSSDATPTVGPPTGAETRSVEPGYEGHNPSQSTRQEDGGHKPSQSAGQEDEPSFAAHVGVNMAGPISAGIFVVGLLV